MGNNTQEAILKVKMDLGNEAMILNTRKVRRKGLFGFFKKPMIEVLAAIDEDYGKKKEIEIKKIDDKMQTTAKEVEIKNNFDKKEEKISELENKVSNMESMLEKIYNQIQAGEKKENTENTEKIEKIEKKEKVLIHEEIQKQLPNVLQNFYDNLLKNEVELELSKKIIDAVKNKIEENASINESASLLYNVISGMLGRPEIIKQRDDGKPTIIILVGPTGVGKTTTLAKIAANYSLNLKKSVGLITADTYRIAAVEQLKTYAEILGMPVAVIYSPSEMRDAIIAYSDKDFILIDTAGRSHRNKAQFEELKALVQETNSDEIYLVLSSTTSFRNCKEILDNYNFLKDYKLIFTKLDEAPVTGIILNARALTGKSLSYVTTGQSVPDDIEVINVEKITKILLGSNA